MKAKVFVTLKKGVLDPQGKAVEHALEALGYKNVKEVRVGKFFEIELEDSAVGATGRSPLQEMAEKLLANTVIEDYQVEVEK
jgi:phosphoribosylformylglycinamidine synthase PurS subunit